MKKSRAISHQASDVHLTTSGDMSVDLEIRGNYNYKTKLICVDADLNIFMLAQDKSYIITS
jgi:hypothetical protein